MSNEEPKSRFDAYLDEALEWRKKPHKYQKGKVIGINGELFTHLFCGKCGLSEGNEIHE